MEQTATDQAAADWKAWEEEAITRLAGGIRSARKSAGLTQEQLADAVGVSKGQVANLESSTKGRVVNLPSVGTLVRLALALGTPPVELLFPELPDGRVKVWPGAETTSIKALQWFSGEELAHSIQEDGEFRGSDLLRVTMSREYARLLAKVKEAEDALWRLEQEKATPDELDHARSNITFWRGKLTQSRDYIANQGWPVDDA